jgi:hypothetical protein
MGEHHLRYRDGTRICGRWCAGCVLPPPRPTILTFHGETGEAAIGKTLAFVDMLDPNTWCPAPTPEAP